MRERVMKWLQIKRYNWKNYDIFLSEKSGRERCPSICLSFEHENTPQDIQSNKRGVISYFHC